MKRATTWVLTAVAVVGLALAAAAEFAQFHAPALPGALLAIAIVCALLLILRALPLNARRPVVFLLALVVIVAVVGGLSVFQFVLKPTIVKNAISAAFAPKPTAVAVEEAKVEQWPPQLEAIGTLRAFQGIVVAPQVAGVVSAIHFEFGRRRAGRRAAGRPRHFGRSGRSRQRARPAQERQRDSLERAERLIATGNTPQSTVDAALAARDSAAASVEHTRAVIAEKAIKAPFAGRLGLRNVDLGQYVAAGVGLTTLQQLDPIYVDFSAPEGALATLAVGQETTLSVDAQPGRAFAGKVTAIDARVSADSRNVTVRAEFANADHKLLPGMFADVTVTTGAPAQLLTVPRTAIVYSLYGDNAFVVVPGPSGNGLIVERRFIRVGAARGERIAIAEGLKVGDKVVIAGQIKLQQNSPVDDRPGRRLAAAGRNAEAVTA